MRFLKRSRRTNPRVSLVLLDWSVRESFHLLHYLSRQSLPRDQFEVLVVEFYSRESQPLQAFAGEVDTWLLLEMPARSCYHKHLMYNAGILFARGEIVVFCDSDAMVRETFLESIVSAFREDRGIVLHVDQFRNVRRDLYPFAYPSFDEVTGPGCLNASGGRTTGMADSDDPLHDRNYGACMAALRSDLVRIGGADQHIDFLGHICGPYEMTFRLLNAGLREVWHEREFMYHTWHPGQAGAGNYLGPHDGRHMSTTALDALIGTRIQPYVENPAIGMMRTGRQSDSDVLAEQVVAALPIDAWTAPEGHQDVDWTGALASAAVMTYRGFRIEVTGDAFTACPIVAGPGVAGSERPLLLSSQTVDGIREQVDRAVGSLPRAIGWLATAYVLVWRALAAGHAGVRDSRRILRGRFADGAQAQASGIRGGVSNRWRRLRTEIRDFSEALRSLVVSLDRLDRGARGGDGRVPVLLSSRALALFVGMLGQTGIYRRISLARISRRNDLVEYVLNQDAEGRLHLVSRDCYLRYHSTFRESPIHPRVIVV